MEIPCWPLKKTLRRVFPTSQENMREECFEAAQELEISFVKEILFDWSQGILHLLCRWFAIPLESMNTISLVNGHKKWYWHAEKETEQKGRAMWICQLKRCCFDKSSFREKKIKLLTFDKSSFSDRTVLMGLCGLLDHTRVLPTFTTTWNSINVWKHPAFENICIWYVSYTKALVSLALQNDPILCHWIIRSSGQWQQGDPRAAVPPQHRRDGHRQQRQHCRETCLCAHQEHLGSFQVINIFI